MANKNPLTKNRVFAISNATDELLRLYSSREGLSLSEMIRLSVEEKIGKFKLEDEMFWKDLPADRFNEILTELTGYLDEHLADNGRVICTHNDIWQKNNHENFRHTKDFCRELHIEWQTFLKRIEQDEQGEFRCECQLYEILKNQRSKD